MYELLMLKVRAKRETYKKYYFDLKNMDTYDKEK